MENEIIICLANAEWDWINRLNCHHIMEHLAVKNRVLFVETIGGRKLTQKDLSKVLRRIRKAFKRPRRVKESLIVISPLVIPSYSSALILRLNNSLLYLQIQLALGSQISQGERPILWFYLPYPAGLVGKLREKLVVYHCVDQHAANPGAASKFFEHLECRLLQMADLVLVSSKPLYEEKGMYSNNIHYLPNVADTSLFLFKSADIPYGLKKLKRPIIGYIGNISSYKIDIDLVYDVAVKNPEWSFVFIGPVGRGDPSTDLSRLISLSNVTFLGPISRELLPAYVQAFDVCWIPFRLSQYTHYSFPLKFFEYMASGRPIISTPLSCFFEYQGHFRVFHNADSFAEAVRSALREDAQPDRVEARLRVAKEHSWDSRMKEIESLVENALSLKGI